MRHTKHGRRAAHESADRNLLVIESGSSDSLFTSLGMAYAQAQRQASGETRMTPVHELIKSPEFRNEARAFAKWYGLERKAAFEIGRIASGWLEHYSRSRNAERLADALCSVTGLRITGRSISYYRDIYLLDKSWRDSKRGCRAKSRNHFKIRHVGPGHLRVVAGAKLPESKKLDLLDVVERDCLTVKETTGQARKKEMEHNRSRRAVRLRPTDPRVVHGDCIDVVTRLKPESIHHCFCDWQWENTGIWRESFKATPVHRPEDPIEHLCRFLEAVAPYLDQQGIVWIFSKTTAFPNGEIGLPHVVQKAAFDLGLRYCSEFVAPHTVAGYRSKNTFLAIKHLPLHPFVKEGFDHSPVEFATSVGTPTTSPNHISQLGVGTERHPYQKSVELFEQLVQMGTPHGQIFDAFAGSGAAGVAAVRLGCPYLGAELQRDYVRMANRSVALALAEHEDSARSA